MEEGMNTRAGHPPDTFLDMTGWGKGLVWVNGFNLGWYSPLLGPQMAMYVPGPLLRAGQNDIVLLEFAQEAKDQSGANASLHSCFTCLHAQLFLSSWISHIFHSTIRILLSALNFLSHDMILSSIQPVTQWPGRAGN